MKNTILLIAAGVLLHLDTNAQTTVNYKFDGEKNIKISLKNSNLKIVGYEGDGAVISATKGDGQVVAKDKTDLKIVNGKNLLTIEKLGEDDYTYLIKVPRKTNIDYTEEFRAPKQLEIADIDGKVTVNSWVSKIVLKNVSGPINATSKAADISIDYTSIGERSPGTIESAGRLVEVTLPANAKVDLTLAVSSGNVYSDFDLGAANKAALLQAGTERKIEGKINGGGTSLRIKAAEIKLHRKG